MINLIPALQLDGGHVAYALLGDRYPRLSRFVRAAVLPLAFGVALWLGAPAFAAGRRGDALWGEAGVPGMQWFIWWLLLSWMGRRSEQEHPPTDPGPLSPGRRAVAVVTLLLFVALFMPAWMRLVDAELNPNFSGICRALITCRQMITWLRLARHSACCAALALLACWAAPAQAWTRASVAGAAAHLEVGDEGDAPSRSSSSCACTAAG